MGSFLKHFQKLMTVSLHNRSCVVSRNHSYCEALNWLHAALEIQENILDGLQK